MYFSYKTNVVDEEILSFLEVIDALNALEKLTNSNLNSQKELKKELDEVVSNPRLIYGVVKKTTKDEKILKLKYKHEKSVSDSESSAELYSLVSSFVPEVEIPLFKSSHSDKWNSLLNNVAEQRLKKMKTEYEFWNVMSNNTRKE